MNVLPWLLDWPPRPAAIVFFVVVTVFSVGTLVLFGGVPGETGSENVSIEEADVTVRLNDEQEFPDTGNGSVQTCMASGTPGDSISVLGDVVVEVPPETVDGKDSEVAVVVSLNHTEESRTMTVEDSGRRTSDVFWVLPDDETLSVGETVGVQVNVRSDEKVLANATTPMVVQNGTRTYDC